MNKKFSILGNFVTKNYSNWASVLRMPSMRFFENILLIFLLNKRNFLLSTKNEQFLEFLRIIENFKISKRKCQFLKMEKNIDKLAIKYGV